VALTNAKRFANPLKDAPGYMDVNASFGIIPFKNGITGGVFLTFKGIYYYFGNGLMSPGPGAALTFSPGTISEGQSIQVQFGGIIGGSLGYSYPEINELASYSGISGIIKRGFWELGIMIPGFSITKTQTMSLINYESIITFYNLFFIGR
jgi:hypothetical protein